MAEFLEQSGWEVVQAGDGDAGLKLALQHRPEAVVCDLLMPGGNGFQFCSSLRRQEALSKTRIIVTSGRDFASDRQAAFSAGADEYLTKPVAPGQLLGLLSRGAGGFEPIKSKPAAPAPAPAAPLNHKGVWFKFWGVRGSIPTPGPGTVRYGGNTSCIEVRIGGQIIILDAGTGLRGLGRELIAEFNDQPLDLTLLLTHTHWDHIQGLPFFLPVYKPRNRLRILGYEGARLGLDNVLTGQMESPFFPIGLREVPGNVKIEELKEMEFRLDQVRVQACFANHPGICVGYRITTPAGSLAFFPDNETHRPKGRAGDGPAAIAFAQQQNARMIDFVRGTDVLIMDSQYDVQEYESHVGWGHGCVDDVVALAMAAEVKTLFLFHHDPDHDDDKVDRMLEHARHLVTAQGGKLKVEAAQEGRRVELTAVEK